MAYVCPECDYESENPGVCADCGVVLVEEKAETDLGETGGIESGEVSDEVVEDEGDAW